MRQRTWRLLMLLIALLITSSLLWLALYPGSTTHPRPRALPTNVREAAEKALPGFKLDSYNSERFSGEPAWELRGASMPKGHFQKVFRTFLDSGEAFLIEPGLTRSDTRTWAVTHPLASSPVID